MAIQSGEEGGSACWAVTELICSLLFILTAPSFLLSPPEAASMDGRVTDRGNLLPSLHPSGRDKQQFEL